MAQQCIDFSLSLEKTILNLIAFYDPVIGRFTTIDRFAEKYHSMTGYQYAGLNPTSHIDMNGDSIINIIRDKNTISILNSPSQAGGKNFYNKITLGSSVNQSHVTDYSVGIGNDAMISINDNGILISSGSRSPKEQAAIMYGNIINGSPEGEKDTYKAAGDKVIDTYINVSKVSKDPTFVQSEMLKTIEAAAQLMFQTMSQAIQQDSTFLTFLRVVL